MSQHKKVELQVQIQHFSKALVFSFQIEVEFDSV